MADRGYFKFEDIEACEQAGMTPYVASRSADQRCAPALLHGPQCIENATGPVLINGSVC